MMRRHMGGMGGVGGPRWPFFPFVIPFLFPMGLFFTLVGLTTWFSYRSWRELEAIRMGESHEHDHPVEEA